jgi:transglutaminase-like putative cysteine protease
MSRRREPFGPAFLLSVVAAATTWLALTAWSGFVVVQSSYLKPLVLLAFLIACSGSLLRWVGTPRWATTLAQLLLTTVIVTHEITGSLLPVGGAGRELWHALGTSIDTARQYAAPIGVHVPEVWPLLFASGAAFVVLVDTVACTYRRVPGAGLVLLAVYSVPSGFLDDGPQWTSFVGAAAGFLVLLHLEARDRLARWGRPVGPEEDSLWHGHPVVEAMRAGAGRIGITATALALIVPAFVPVLGVDLLHFGKGNGNGDIQIRKPLVDMRRDLERGKDVPMIRIKTNDPAPSYLRVSVLNRYTGDEWSSGDRNVASKDVADGPLPRPQGLSRDIPFTKYRYQVDITDSFDSTWLPTQFPAAAVDASGDWRYDPTTMDFLAANGDLDTRGLSYTMVGLSLDYGVDGRFFRNSRAGDVPDELLSVPTGVPTIARSLAQSVTRGASNDYERALLLQRWFRQDGGFRYDLRRAPDGTGNQTLETFLARSGRVGYCEQYASAMAVMARILGIPARVAVGFLQPQPLGDGMWEYSSHDLHAWPELYFEGTGWVRFEPTPAGRVDNVPAYSRVPVDGGTNEPGGLPSQTGQQPTGSSGSATTGPNPHRRPEVDTTTGGQVTTQESGPSALVVAGGIALLVLLLAAVALAGPRSLRARTRARRLDGGPEQIWAELRASAIDLGLPWPDGRSPREVGTALVGRLGDPAEPPQERPRTGADVAPEAADALERVVLALERQRYARPSGGGLATLAGPVTLTEDAALVVAALEAGATPHARRRARWLPRTTWGMLTRR